MLMVGRFVVGCEIVFHTWVDPTPTNRLAEGQEAYSIHMVRGFCWLLAVHMCHQLCSADLLATGSSLFKTRGHSKGHHLVCFLGTPGALMSTNIRVHGILAARDLK